MAEDTYSQGPWRVVLNSYGTVFVYGSKQLISPMGSPYPEVIAGGDSHSTLTEANAHLIAAAPDLPSPPRRANR